MRCSRLSHSPEAAPLAHRLMCRECRHAREADRMLGLAVECMAAEAVPANGPARVLRALSLPVAGTAMQQNLRRQAVKRSWQRRVAALLTLVLAAQTWLWWIDRDPPFRVPEPEMPSPNAFTYFRAAGMALTAEKEVGEALAVPRAESAATRAPLAQIEDLVSRESRALQLLRAGFAYEYREPPARSFNHLYPHYAKFRSLARLLALEAQVHERHGRIAQANAGDLDAVELGMRVRNGSGVIGALVGIACSALGRAGLWARVDRMDAREARAALARLDRIERLRPPVAFYVREEMYTGMAGLMEQMRDPRWRWKLGGLISVETEGSLFEAALRKCGMYAALLPFSKTSIVRRYMLNLQQEMHCAQAYPARPSDYRPDMRDPLNRVLLPVFSALSFTDARDRCTTNLLQVALAMRIYRLEKGRQPRSLQELVEAGCIGAIPTDPFSTAGEPMRFTVSAGNPVVYSLGPDLTDNGGAPIGRITDYQEPLDRSVAKDSVGDIVAGVNTP